MADDGDPGVEKPLVGPVRRRTTARPPGHAAGRGGGCYTGRTQRHPAEVRTMAARGRQGSRIGRPVVARRWGGVLGALLLLVLGCAPAAPAAGPSAGSPPAGGAAGAAPPPAAAAPAAPAVTAAAPERGTLKVAVLGITAGAGI